MVRWNQIVLVLLISQTVLFRTSSGLATCKICKAYTKHLPFVRLRQQPSLVANRGRYESNIIVHTGSQWPSSRSVSLKCNNNSNREDSILQQLVEPFDRWRYLQKFLDEDINDASDILFVLRTFVRQQLQQQQQLGDTSSILDSDVSLTSVTLPIIPIVNVESTNSDATMLQTTTASKTEGLEVLVNKVASSLDYDDNYIKAKRRKIMEFIVNDVSSVTIRNLIQTSPNVDMDDNEILFLELIEQLLPNPETDEDASKGLWDTVIELHGRESVKINERTVPQDIGWKTRCLIARLLIYYDFLTDGLNSTRKYIATT
jgi:hypothetical protein